MAWFYHSGSVVRPIPVKKGLSKSVRPKSKVEILQMTPEAEALIRKGLLRKCPKPKGAPSAAEVVVSQKKVEDVVKKPDLAKSVAEKGVTTDKSVPPVSSGTPEKTEGEVAVGAGGDGDKDEKEGDADEDGGESPENTVAGAEKVDQAESLNENRRKKLSKKKRR